MGKPLFALIDCNNFFASCERIFRPDLHRKPVVVLSSNDGCVVARSNEAKALGIPMAAPAFKYRNVLQANNVIQFSANFELYGSISKRITELLTTITPRIEVYSVDESFLDLSQLPIHDYHAWASTIRKRLWKEIGIPVSVGIAPSKTLAKLASDIAKKDPQYRGVCDLAHINPKARAALLQTIPVERVWGVGRKITPKLKAAGVGTAYSLGAMRPQHAQQLMGVIGREMALELQGTACKQLEQEGQAIKSIMRGRTFGEDTNALHVLEAAIATMSARAAFRLRRDHLLARTIGFYVTTNRHKPGYRSWHYPFKLGTPTNDTGTIISTLCAALVDLHEPGQQYHQLGVYLHHFVPDTSLQTDVFGQVDIAKHTASTSRMQALDAINRKWGRGKLRYAAEDLSDSWQPRQHIRSPRYVSNWSELPEAWVRPPDS